MADKTAAGRRNGKSPSEPQTAKPATKSASSLSIMDILRIVGGLFLLNCLLSYFITNDSVLWGWRPWFIRPAVLTRYFQGPVHLTDAQLVAYDGSDPKKPIYLALNGTIYDVSAGARVYGPGGSYNVFAGKDAARGFITGCFAEDGTPDLRGAEYTYVASDIPLPAEYSLDPSTAETEKVTGAVKSYRSNELRRARKQVQDTIEGWSKMFRGEGGKDYFEVGKVIREEGWLEKEPKKALCAQAIKGRPKPRSAPAQGQAADAGAQYRGGR
ncbi:hypothetical protein LTR10_002194 [Elasticomyces elasticus]|nr:hypothetical protein LTR10_002194 [Elasticomyces elasticus]KAK4973732.1 hypothetical protein LTR42_005721 [Elasticomyces elasticus]